MIEFKQLTGMEFGDHGKKWFNLYEGKNIIHIRTGSTSEETVGFRSSGFLAYDPDRPDWTSFFGSKWDAIFSEDMDAVYGPDEGLSWKSMYMTSDGVDPVAGSGANFKFPPRKNANLKPNTDYYFIVTVYNKTPVRFDYFGTNYEEEYQLLTEEEVVPEPVTPPTPPPAFEITGDIPIAIAGVEGTWTAKAS